MPTVYYYRGGQRPIKASAADTVSGITNPAQTYLIYTNPVAVKKLTNDDDASNNVNDLWPRPRHGIIQVLGGVVRFAYGTNPSATKGIQVEDGGLIDFDNQPELITDIRFIAESGTPVVTFLPLG